jgi:hypothetical protein
MTELNKFDAITDVLRQSAVDLSTLSRPADPAQVDAMTALILTHQYRVTGGEPGTKTPVHTVCDCGWSTLSDPANFRLYQWEVTRHIMADIVARVFTTPTVK